MNQEQKDFINSELEKLNKAREHLKILNENVTKDYLNGINWLEKYAITINNIYEDIK